MELYINDDLFCKNSESVVSLFIWNNCGFETKFILFLNEDIKKVL